jgi:hypothetical protein
MIAKQDEIKPKQAATQTPGGSAAAKPVAQQTGTFRYIDRPDCMETFADCITGLAYDGQTLRLEFGVTRVDEVKPNMPVGGRRYTACRLALSQAAAIDLINKMQQIANALTQAGVVKPAPVPPTERA